MGSRLRVLLRRTDGGDRNRPRSEGEDRLVAHLDRGDQKAVWQKLADEYMAAHPNVTIEITVLENEAFKTKLTTVMQSGEPPDIFQSWGGGVMNEYVEAGLLKDITAELDADGGAWRNTFAPGALGVYCLQGQELRRTVGHGHGRFLVQQGALRPGWHCKPRPQPGPNSSMM